MDAIPYAIYTAPTSVFRTDIVERISTDEQPCCYIQLLERLSYLSYAVLVASSCDDLLALHRGDADEAVRDHVLVSTISRQDLHQCCSLIVAPEAEAPLYAAPAAILADKDLLIASAAWLTYFRVVRCYADGSTRIRLAALPHRVETDGAYFTTLTREEFAQALPLSRRELNLATCDLLELVEAHARSVTGRPVEHIAPEVILDDEEDTEHTPAPARSYPPEVLAMLRIKDEDQPRRKARPQQQGPQQDKALQEAQQQGKLQQKGQQQNKQPQQKGQQQDKPQVLESVYVSAEIAAATMQQFSRHTGTVPLSRTLRQKAWLQAALFAIKQHREQPCADEARLSHQDERLRTVLVHGVFRAARLVWVEPVGEPVGDSPLTAVYRGYSVHVEKMIAVA